MIEKIIEMLDNVPELLKSKIQEVAERKLENVDDEFDIFEADEDETKDADPDKSEDDDEDESDSDKNKPE